MCGQHDAVYGKRMNAHAGQNRGGNVIANKSEGDRRLN
jgi:hypothetical protein